MSPPEPERPTATRRGAARRLATLSESWIREMTRLALKHEAINLGQGFPDFDPPLEVRAAASHAVLTNANQYTVTWGLPALRDAIARSYRERWPAHFDWVDPAEHVTVTCGVTEAIVSAVMAVADPDDDLLIVEPAHENYGPAAIFAGARPVYVPLLAPDFRLDADRLRDAITPRTKAILLNSPHNPTGRVLDRGELEAIASLARERDLLVITDEIYDRILYDGREHIPLATLEGMRDRTITISGLSKTFAVTGWRLGYAVADRRWSSALRKVHDFTTICAPTPLQTAGVAAFALPASFYEQQTADYHARREVFLRVLARSGFEVSSPPEGAYYVLAAFPAWGFDGDGHEFARFLTTEVGVAAVGGQHFYRTPNVAGDLVRFAFAKRLETLEAAGDRLASAFAAR